MKEKLSNAPLYYALAQVKFNTVAAMERYVNEIQDFLRIEGYTLFEPRQSTSVRLATAQSDRPLNEPQIEQSSSWLVTRGDQTAGFILDASSITFHTTHYVTYEDFIPELLLGLKTVHRAVQLEHISRVGLRYLDAVCPQPNETVGQYLIGELRGIDLNQNRKFVLHQSVFDTETGPLINEGTLVARVYEISAPLGYPEDLFPHGLQNMPKFAAAMEKDQSHAVIDTDHFVEGRIPLDFEKIEELLLNLHQKILQVFVASTTDHARKVWAAQ